MGIRPAVVGTGQFAKSFIPLFQAHPLVDEVALCDLDAAKLRAAASAFEVERTYPSLDAAKRDWQPNSPRDRFFQGCIAKYEEGMYHLQRTAQGM